MSADGAEGIFEAMVDSVGIKAYAASIGLSTRQIHRMLNGSQPNPIQRFVEAVLAGEGLTGQQAVDYVCRRAGGYFVTHAEDLAKANVNAVKECAEAIVAISEHRAVRVEIKEIREAISALAALERLLTESGERAGQGTEQKANRNAL